MHNFNSVIEEIVQEYCKRRNKFIKCNWLTWKSVVNRILRKRNEKEFNILRKEDIQFQKDFEKWVTQYLKEVKVSKSEIEEYIYYLENHTSKLQERVSFLHVVLAISVLGMGLFLDPNKIPIVLIIFLFIGIVYSEHDNIKNYEYTYKEIINVLKKIKNMMT